MSVALSESKASQKDFNETKHTRKRACEHVRIKDSRACPTSEKCLICGHEFKTISRRQQRHRFQGHCPDCSKWSNLLHSSWGYLYRAFHPLQITNCCSKKIKLRRCCEGWKWKSLWVVHTLLGLVKKWGVCVDDFNVTATQRNKATASKKSEAYLCTSISFFVSP